MKKILKLIMILMVVMLIIIAIIAALVIKRENYGEEDIIKIEEIDELAKKNMELHLETNRNRFYLVKSCINKFYNAYQKLNPENSDGNTELVGEETNSEYSATNYAEEVLSMLDKEYIDYADITINNISEKLGKIEKTTVEVDKIYTKDLENSEYICFAEGRLQKRDSSKEEKFQMIIRLGGKNCFKVLLQDYIIDKKYNDFGKDFDVSNLVKAEITDDIYNTFKNQAISAKEYINDLFEHYKVIIVNNQENAYKLLNEEYKNIRFSDIQDYLSYRKENYIKLATSRLEKYNYTIKDSYTEYLFQDNHGNYYIFKETAPFQYTVMLDNYTIQTDDFIQTYNESTEVEKVVLNIKRFFMGIDDKNYGYSYSVLSESFKANKYPTKDAFVQYAKQYFFEENEIEYISCEKQNGLYIYKIKIKDATGKNTETKSLNMIVKLNDGTDFEMSFGID